MKHFGIWDVNSSSWMLSANGIIFWTTSRAVAEAQIALDGKISFNLGPLEIREFIDTPGEQ